MHYLFYFVTKLVAYGFWCTYGLRLFRSPKSWQFFDGFAYGLGRLFMGFLFGLVIWIGTNWIKGVSATVDSRDYLAYLLVYVPVRWIEWSIFSYIISLRRSNWLATVLVGQDSTDRLWRFGGTAISCLTDIAILFAFGNLPMGHLVC
jgi:hypothetical protein